MENSPNLLIVGAMKCATTTLYELLAAHIQIYEPEVKEPAFLARRNYSAGKCKELYNQLFANAGSALYRIEGSTGYTMRPRIDHCAERARQILGPEVRIIYMIREPLGRIQSHYKHLLRSGQINNGFEESCRALPEFITFSQYFYQIKPWVDLFGQERVYLIDFDDFTRNSQVELAKVQKFLQLKEPFPHHERVANAGAGQQRLPKWVNRIQRTALYKTRVASLLPNKTKRWIKGMLGRKPPKFPVDYSPDLANYVLDQLRDDYSKLRTLLPFEPEDNITVWNFDRLIQTHTPSEASNHES